MSPDRALDVLRPGDAALGRLDVLPTLDGMDEDLWALGVLAARGVIVMNDPAALLAAHDKLLTARLLSRNGVPHPRTSHVRGARPTPVSERAVVIKPRFGSWGRDVYRCDDHSALQTALDRVRYTGWYRRHGALIQELVPAQGYDLRILVAAGYVVGSVYRIAAPDEWRTNIALGGVRRPVLDPPPVACELAVAAARATGVSLAGVDLLPDECEGWTVVEVNGAFEFTPEYTPCGAVFAKTAHVLTCAALEWRARWQVPAPATAL